MGNKDGRDPYLEMQREEIAKRQIDTDALGKEWVHDPTPQSPNRWVNTDTGEYRYQEQKPGESGGDGSGDGPDRTDDQRPMGGGGEEADVDFSAADSTSDVIGELNEYFEQEGIDDLRSIPSDEMAEVYVQATGGAPPHESWDEEEIVSRFNEEFAGG